ncbi:homeobox-DDT domain protein RLT1 isoform X3 [Prosopis cineraria]|uniref:homeobox-DDT domain protein RLT1 isoform X3 n=1 Tax=Prosopis cineraria TaxID=364024 RepID=UPI00240F08A5|nr:homeobox-DDT domain protein RLT1 isoform X3 [Prosopis cineraria]
MEAEDASDGENNRKMDTGDDYNDNDNGSNKKALNSNEGHSKPKRQMKTPFQLESLEKAYALETYPSEAMRAELSQKLGLSDRQLQMWFCHRRLKDKKDVPKPSRKAPAPLPTSPTDELRMETELANDYGSGSGSGSSPFTRSEMRNVVPRGVPGYYESQQALMEHRAISCVEAQLGELLREDGPILGVEFDPLPPDAFGAPIVTEKLKRPSLGFDNKVYERHDVRSNKAMTRAFHEYPFLPNHSSIRSDAYGQLAQSHLHDSMDGPARTPSFVVKNEPVPRIHAAQGHSSRVRLSSLQDKQGLPYPSPTHDDDGPSQRESYANLNIGMNAHFTDHPIVGPENPYAVVGGQIFHSDAILRLDRKRKSDDSRTAREAEAHEMRIQKEIEKQDNIRRKNEERMRKEMERQDRERRKEEERLMRERQREEERTKREQRREIERREKFLKKENLRAEKRRQKEELRKEKEAERRKAALEKAVARRIAKESMELIEDEQLELMELAVASKGLPSIINLDLDTLQNLDTFRDSLCIFPPKRVKLKRPFSIQPWIKSEEHVGNLLMVWRFLITFADVLELWPFTLDEFLQAFHDYDSRLFGEIHVALLKVIIKDIEDVARTPTGLGTNQNGAANPGGGHPEIVEGAYAWGFDIRNWQKHLNQSTWPEIFRQLALSAGFGPRLKKRNITWSYATDKDEQGRSCEDIISTLRNGSAAENAVAKMQEKGLLAPRRNRHRLTPGTVKFAAFHVLSLEGSKGLTVLELAEKIQKSGLRDLTTSKTPEASISVALTRDAKLFERIAPSTYRVRAAFRKDPADAEAILSDARKKIQIFENGFPTVEDADDVEREEESESDEVDEDPEVDDLVNPLSDNKTSEQYDDMNNCSTNGGENMTHDMELIQNEFGKDIPCVPENCSKDAACPSAVTRQRAVVEDLNTGNPEDNMEIDESKSGESWVLGLTEGEYSDLSVEERLNALVALVGVANEGNSIRLVLEDRLEAANALKKQMWAEAQIDKVRQKDDNSNKSDFPSLTANKVDTQYTGPAVEGNQSPLLDMNINNNEASPSPAENQKEVLGAQNMPIEKPSVGQDLFIGPDNPQILSAHASKRSRSQLKSYIAHIAEEMYVYRSLPLGQDRRRNRYWQFVASASSSDPGAGRVFIELNDGSWRLIDSEEDFDVLSTSLDSRGIRESHLRLMLQKIENSFKENVRKNAQFKKIATKSIKNEADDVELVPECRAGSDSSSSTLCGLNSDSTSETSSSFKIELGKVESEKKAAVIKYQDIQKWMWKECYNSSTLYSMKYGQRRCKPLLEICDMCLNPYFFEDSHCNSCHHTFATNNGFNFSKHAFQCREKLDTKGVCIWDSSLPLRIRLLKALLACIEASVPLEALQSIWTEENRKQWGVKLSKTSTTDELLQLLTLLERSVQRDFLSSTFSTTEEMLGSSCMPDNAVNASTDTESVPVLPWVPLTAAAVSLRIFEFDASISYVPAEKHEPQFEEKEVREYARLSSRYAPFKSGRAIESAELDHDEFIKEDKSSRSVRSSNKRGRGSHDHGRGKKLSRRTQEPKQHTGRRNVRSAENLGRGLKQQGRGTQGQPGGRGRRTVRKRRVEKRAVEDLLLGHKGVSHSPKISRESLRSLEEEWDGEKEASPVQIDGVDNSNSAEEVESDDNGQAVEYGQGNWEVGFNGGSSNRWDRDLVGVSDEEVVGVSEDDNGIEGEELEEELEEDSEEEVMSEGEDSDGVGNRMMVNEEGSDSAVSEDSSD